MENTKFTEIKKYKGYKKIGNNLDYIVTVCVCDEECIKKVDL